VAVQKKEGRRVRADVRDGGRLFPTSAVVVHRRLEHAHLEERLHVDTARAMAVDEVVHPVERHRGNDGRVGVLEAGLEVGHVRRQSR